MAVFQNLYNLFQPPSYHRKRNYILGHIIGQGTYGVVREAFSRSTSKTYAIKIIHKKNFSSISSFPQREIASLALLDHPNIMRLVEYFESRKKHYLVCELATGGELFDRIIERGCFTEADAACLINRIVSAIAEAHRKGIVHRDRKPGNLLFRSPEALEEVLIADFGISRTIAEGEVLFTLCGSPGYYVAPEFLLSTEYGKACDMWSIGVITYTILCGYSPFGPVNRAQCIMKLKFAGPVIFDERYWSNVSECARQFIFNLLQIDPKLRLTADEALNHPWLAARQNPFSCEDNPINLLSDVMRNELTRTRADRLFTDVVLWLRLLRKRIDAGQSENVTNNEIGNEHKTVDYSLGNHPRDTFRVDDASSVLPIKSLDSRVEEALVQLLGPLNGSTTTESNGKGYMFCQACKNKNDSGITPILRSCNCSTEENTFVGED